MSVAISYSPSGRCMLNGNGVPFLISSRIVIPPLCRVSPVLPDCFFACLCGGGKRVWLHSQYKVFSVCYDFHGVLIGKINTMHTVCYTAFLSDRQQSLTNTN